VISKLTLLFFLFTCAAFASPISLEEVYSKLEVQEIFPVTINGKPVIADFPSAVCTLAGYKLLVGMKNKQEFVKEAYRSTDSSTLVLEQQNGQYVILTSVTCAR